ncbi:hypothetical protein J4Q44_G00348390 [Coregonus suidteri]|uniref:Uncharacterized protein n=1 Tax=Coregonus suidteri TaxID=861788 RepID=A0AAN8KFZ3_9TELE
MGTIVVHPRNDNNNNNNNNMPFSRRFYPKRLTVMCAYIFTYGGGPGDRTHYPGRYKHHALPAELQSPLTPVHPLYTAKEKAH